MTGFIFFLPNTILPWIDFPIFRKQILRHAQKTEKDLGGKSGFALKTIFQRAVGSINNALGSQGFVR